MYTSIIGPILHPSDAKPGNTVVTEGTSIRVSPNQSKSDVIKTFDDILLALQYLQQRLPEIVTEPLAAKIIPTISSALISSWLSPAVPADLAEIDTFQAALERVALFSQAIEDFGWSGTRELNSWSGQITRLWLTKRRVNALDEVRKALSATSGNTKKVERVEKEKVSSKDEVFAESHTNDDWDAWGSDDDENVKPDVTGGNSDEEDVSAWGFDDDEEEPASEEKGTDAGPESTEDLDDAEEAWGWGDENDDTEAADVSKPAAQETSKPVNGQSRASSTQREVTLKELYTVTDIPDSIAAIILRQVTDSSELSGSE